VIFSIWKGIGGRFFFCWWGLSLLREEFKRYRRKGEEEVQYSKKKKMQSQKRGRFQGVFDLKDIFTTNFLWKGCARPSLFILEDKEKNYFLASIRP